MKNFSILLLMIILWQNSILESNTTLSRSEILLNLIQSQTRKTPTTNLNGINLIDLDLSKVNMEDIKMREANILGVNLRNSSFVNADLKNSNFFKSILIGTKFKGADLNGTQNMHKAIYQKCAHFPFNWFRQEYDKNDLDLQQLNNTLSAGYAICQKEYSFEELQQLKKFNIT